MSRSKYKVVDLFCGCGGISRGFGWTGRFGTEFGVEIEPHPVVAFRSNIRNTNGEPSRSYQGDISALAEDPSKLWSELKAAGVRRPREIDVLTGGPPCQGFSRNGVRLYRDQRKSQRFYNDPKNHLYKAFLAIVEITQPKIVLVENVREFLNFNNGTFSTDLVSRFNEIGYDVEFRKICAADYGVPQVRHRVFFVAIRKDVADKTGRGPTFPRPLFFSADSQPSLDLFEKYRTVRDAIYDLPPPAYEKTAEGVAYPINGHISSLAELLRNPNGIVTNHFARTLSPKQVQRINAVGTGRMKNIDRKLRTKAYYGSAYRRLSWDEPALTITTWVYHVGSGRFAHPTEDRGVTMREAARLQSFDDAFIFPPLINPVSQMIGNAVPPLMANGFAKEFVKILDKLKRN